MKINVRWFVALLICACVVAATGRLMALQTNAAAAQAEAAAVAIDDDDIGGVVRSASGPEAGVWVIAETIDLPTKYRKIVVTDDRGRYLLPDLPKANYKIWVRGYGLVDSAPVTSAPGAHLALTAVIAPNAKAAAQIYPANYWYSLMQVPPKDAFPMTFTTAARAGGDGETPAAGRGAAAPAAPAGRGAAGGRGGATTRTVNTQAEWVNMLKCNACHQVGSVSTRSLSPGLGTFPNSMAAWDRAMRSGQTGNANAVDVFGGHERGLAMFADWSDRIAAGEVPQAPPRPQGIERNVVLSIWDYSTQVAFIHDITTTDKLNPTVNPYGRVFGAEWSEGALVTVDPKANAKDLIRAPLKNEADRKLLTTWTKQSVDLPSPTWGDELIWNDPINPHTPMMDGKGRVWFNAQNRAPGNPDYCKMGASNPFAQAFPIETTGGWGLDMYDQATGKFTLIDLCFRTHHTVIGKDETLYFSANNVGIGWFNINTWEKTGSQEKAQGWCQPIADYNGDGKIGAFTRANEPADPALDRVIAGGGYGISTSPVDGAVWYTVNGVPGKLVRVALGSNPPATCMAEVYEPPYNNPAAPGKWGMNPRGVDIDSKGIVWTALSGSNHLASFNRSKCKILNGPKATGQHCPEGWTLYPAPGPKFKGVTDELGTDYFYYNWTDVHNTFGMGQDAQVVTGTWSDSILVMPPGTTNWVTLRVPYPLGFYARGVEGRIDDVNAGWKGRGLWSSNETRGSWLTEGGKGTPSQVAHFQIRPDPLAK